jgi:outer membrane protein assembly factor BamB
MIRGAASFRRVPLHLMVVLMLLAGASLVRGDKVIEVAELEEVEFREIEVAEKIRIARPVEAVDAAKTPPSDAAAGSDEAIQAEFPNSAGLKTDPDLETRMKAAETYAANGRLDLAAIVWQKVLDESGHTVITRPEWTYRSMEGRYRKYKSLSEEIERTVAKLPAAGMRMYRLTADGEAQAILAAGAGAQREEALAEVVRKYFMSSQGDDAAFELGCLRLDRHDFVGAGRLFSKILSDYPDPSIPRGEMLLRLALTNVRVGDVAAAQAALAQLQQTDAGALLARGISLVQAEIDRGVNVESAAQRGDEWHLAWGNPERTGHMPALPEAVTSATLSESWSEDFEVDGGALASNDNNNDFRRGRVVFGGMAMAKASYAQFPQQPGQVMTRDALLQRWKSGGWRPAGHMLLHGGLVYYKRHDRVVCRDSATGDLKWMSRPTVYEGDVMAQWRINMQRAYGMNPQATGPSAPQETFLFSDRLQQAMTICDGVMYTIDGGLEGEMMGVRKGNDQMQQMNWQNVPRRSRTNFLYAYDAVNGKFKWLRAADGSEDGSEFEVGFMAAPVPYARFLLVPVSDGGSQSLLALEKSTGAVVWKTFLCEEPSGASSACSPVGVTVAGGDAYVSTGGGVVFAIDAMSGAVRWAVRYQRTSKGSVDMARFGIPQQQLIDVDGWEEDVVIPHGKSLVVMPSDADKLFALDRRSGELLWESPRKPAADDDPAQYCLGVLDEGLFVAGHKSVRRYDLTKDGRLMWEAKLEPSFGHGVLTADAIYMPVGETVARIDPKTGKRTAQVGVFSPSKSRPAICSPMASGCWRWAWRGLTRCRTCKAAWPD